MRDVYQLLLKVQTTWRNEREACYCAGDGKMWLRFCISDGVMAG